jgi:O-antigen ligase
VTIATLCLFGVALGYGIGKAHWILTLGFLVILLVIRWPVEVAFGLFAFLVPFDSVVLDPSKQEGTSPTWYVGAAAIIIFVATGVVQRRFRRPPKAVLWWSLMVLWASASYLWAVQPDLVSARLATAFGLLTLLALSLSLRFTKEELNWSIWCAIAGGVVAALVSISEFPGATALGSRGTLTIAGKSSNPNSFALTLLLPLALGIGWLITSRRWISRALMLTAIVILAIAQLLTMSRGAVLASGVMLLIFMWRLRLRARLFVPCAAMVLAITSMPQMFFHRFEGALASGGAGRLDIWKAGLSALQKYGLFGVGLDNFPIIYNEFAGRGTRFQGLGRDPHNIYLGFWVETGIFGFLFLLLMVSSHFAEIRSLRRRLQKNIPLQLVAVEAACWGVLVASFFEHMLWRKAFWLVWMFAGITVQVISSSESLRVRSVPWWATCSQPVRNMRPRVAPYPAP